MGGSWAPLGASWGVLGTSWGRLGASWGRLGRILARLGGVLERLGHLQASKIEKSLKNQRKTIKKHPNINLIWHGTGSAALFGGSHLEGSRNDLGSQMLPNAPQISRKSSKNRSPNLPKSRSGGDSAGNRFSIPNRSPNYPLLEVSWGVLGASWARLGAVLELSWGVLGRLGCVLRASWGVLGAPWGAFVVLVVFFMDC